MKKNKKNPTTKTQFEGKGKASLSDEAMGLMGLNPAQRQELDMSTSTWKTTQERDDGTLLWPERTSDIYSSSFYK